MTETSQTETPTLITDAVELTVADRCDACGAQAYVRVGLATGELLFCLHHANENKAKLDPIATSWHDESAKLLAR
jgi:hypothetical protein